MKIITRTKGLVLSCLIQVAVLSWITFERVQLLSSTTEIVLPVAPIDPHDLFRGDYVVFEYEINEIKAPSNRIVKTDLTSPFSVLIERDEGGRWKGELVGPEAMTTRPGQYLVLARIAHGEQIRNRLENQRRLRVRYGIESYFVPEGTGRSLERDALNRKLSVIVAVGHTGQLAIKGLMIDDKTVYREPML